MTDPRPTPECPPSADNATRDWYYRLGDRERGPMTLAQLQDLVSSSGDLAWEIVVKRQSDADWRPYEAVDAATARRLHADRSTKTVLPPAAARVDARPRDGRGPATFLPLKSRPSLRQWIRADWPLVAGILVCAVVNVVLWNWLDPFYGTERRYFHVLAGIAQQAREAREQKLESAERGRMAAAAAKELKPIVDDLKKTASASEPIRQHLLWAAKDQLPKLFSDSGKGTSECEAIFQRHMHEAGRLLGIDVPQPPTSVVIR